MRISLQAGHELLVQGPATTRLISGEVSSLARPFLVDEATTIRAGRLRIIEARVESELDLVIGEQGKIDEVDRSTIPSDWIEFVNKIATERHTHLTIMVLGGPDTGKNTLITYLSNMLLRRGFKVAVMDADMGQSEIGPPATMSLAYLKTPIFELLEVKPESIFFVGTTSPAYVISRVLRGAEELVNHFDSTNGNGDLIVNMPGWISGEGAANFVLQMISKTNTRHLVSLQREKEVEDILKDVKPTVSVTRLSVSPYARPRTRDERKFLRETSYRKYFAGSRVFTIRYGKVDFSPLFSSIGIEAPSKVIKEVENVVKSRVLYCEESNYSINAIVASQADPTTEILSENTTKEEEKNESTSRGSKLDIQKEIRVVPINELTNLMVALIDKKEQLVSLGILKNLDFPTRQVTLSATSRPKELGRVEVGKIRITPQGYEIGFAQIRKAMLRLEQHEV